MNKHFIPQITIILSIHQRCTAGRDTTATQNSRLAFQGIFLLQNLYFYHCTKADWLQLLTVGYKTLIKEGNKSCWTELSISPVDPIFGGHRSSPSIRMTLLSITHCHLSMGGQKKVLPGKAGKYKISSRKKSFYSHLFLILWHGLLLVGSGVSQQHLGEA